MKLTKSQLNMLEKIFSAQLDGSLHETRSKVAKQLETDGYIVREVKNLGKDRFGIISITGYALTLKGNAAYCMSDRCSDEVEGL